MSGFRVASPHLITLGLAERLSYLLTGPLQSVSLEYLFVGEKLCFLSKGPSELVQYTSPKRSSSRLSLSPTIGPSPTPLTFQPPSKSLKALATLSFLLPNDPPRHPQPTPHPRSPFPPPSHTHKPSHARSYR